VAEAMGVKFLAQGNNSSKNPNRESNLGRYDYQADALAACYCLPTYIARKEFLWRNLNV